MCTSASRANGVKAGSGAGGSTTSISSSNGAPALNASLIRRANEASVTDIGDITARQYQRNVDEINATVLSAQDKKDAIAKLHELTEKQLDAETTAINPYASGRGVARINGQLVIRTGDKALNARREVSEFMDSVHAKERDVIAKRHQQAMATAITNALNSGALEFTVNGATYRRKSKRAKYFERVYS